MLCLLVSYEIGVRGGCYMVGGCKTYKSFFSARVDNKELVLVIVKLMGIEIMLSFFHENGVHVVELISVRL